MLRSLLAFALVLGFAASAHAGTVLLTAPLYLPSSGHYLQCLANNLDKQARWLAVEILDVGGSVVAASGDEIAPGGINYARTNNLFASYCRITFDGSKKAVRGTLMLGISGLPDVPQVAVPAQ
jgi:hypothetical protein